MPTTSQTKPLGGGISSPQLAIVPNQDANIANLKKGAAFLNDHGLVEMQDILRSRAWVGALERKFNTTNTSLTNMGILFNQSLAQYALCVSRLVPSVGPILVIMPPLTLTILA